MIRDRVLGSSAGYSTFRRAIKADRSMGIIVDDYIRPVGGHRVLDVGCGNADLADLLPSEVFYLGLDNNPGYIASAKARGVNVIEAHVSELGGLGYESFDSIVLVGVLHHLDDDTVKLLMRDMSAVLSPGGCVVSVDPVNHPGQGMISRSIMAMDRGKYIRRESDYRSLIASSFDDLDVVMRYDLNPFPYAHCIVRAH